jgi:hypothetical protein
VKSGPGLNYERIDKLYHKFRLDVVGRRGDWYAVVYLDEKQATDCNLPDQLTPFATFRDMPYRGRVVRAGFIGVGFTSSRDRSGDWITEDGDVIDEPTHLGGPSGTADALMLRECRIGGTRASNEFSRLLAKFWETHPRKQPVNPTGGQ